MQKLDDKHFLITCTNKTKIRFFCDQESTYQSLYGTYLIEVPEGCGFSTKVHTVRNYENQLRGIPIKLLTFQLTNITIENIDRPLLLENIPLDEVYRLESLIEKEVPVRLDEIPMDKSPFWTLPIYLILGLVIVFYLRKRWILSKNRSRSEEIAMETQDRAVPSSGSRPFFSREAPPASN